MNIALIFRIYFSSSLDFQVMILMDIHPDLICTEVLCIYIWSSVITSQMHYHLAKEIPIDHERVQVTKIADMSHVISDHCSQNQSQHYNSNRKWKFYVADHTSNVLATKVVFRTRHKWHNNLPCPMRKFGKWRVALSSESFSVLFKLITFYQQTYYSLNNVSLTVQWSGYQIHIYDQDGSHISNKMWHLLAPLYQKVIQLLANICYLRSI